MGDRSQFSRERVRNSGIKLRLLAVFGSKRRLVRPPQTEVQGQAAPDLPIVLHVQGVLPPPRQPSGEGLGEGRAAHRTQQETGESVSGVGCKRKLGSAEVVGA